MDSIVENFCRV